MSGHLVGRFAGIDEHFLQTRRLAVFAVDGFCLNCDFLLLVPPPPAPLIQSLMQSDAVNPRSQGRLAVERSDSAEDLDEDVLGEVGGV